MINRRDFSASLLGTGVGALAVADVAHAQGGPIEGKNFVRLTQLVPTSVAADKIEVIEFFWYGCPHCNAFEPALDAWSKKLPADAVFHRVPVAFRPEPFVAHQRIFYALESMGLVESMHRKVFYGIHHDHRRLDKPEEISAFMAQSGVDAVTFMQAYSSFTTQTKLRQADQLVNGYMIDGVPAIGVHGRFYTSGPLAGDNEKSLLVADALMQRIRTHT
jgi:protein dithiol oxidoreductase (disulfide-forming)